MSIPKPVEHLVVVGASAGGIEALSVLVGGLPADFPAPLIIAQHLDPTRPSHLEEILARRSPLPVRTVVDHAPLAPGTVFVVPSDRHVRLSDHTITLSPDGPGRPKPSVDLLFRSAAEVFGDGLIAVVLSGTGSDGAEGAHVVKEAGGTVVIQDPQTASFPGMPSAIAPTAVDIVAPLERIGPLLADLVTGAHMPGRGEDAAVDAILALVREQTGFDFGPYKRPTIRRRLQRRLVATRQPGLDAYRAYLSEQTGEAERLASSFLIKVTTFFRDPEVFTELRERVVPELVARASERGDELRLWSAGCATGEEAYSLAILVADAQGDDPGRPVVRLFATDLDRGAVAYARRGVFPEKAVANVPDELRARHFTRHDDGAYEVQKAVRAMIVFGEHDLGQRAPSIGATGRRPMAAPTIALLDNDPSFLTRMHDLLAEEGYRTLRWHARAGEDPHALLRNALPDLVILDLGLGGRRRGGWDLLKRLWSDCDTTHLPAIVLADAHAASPIPGSVLQALRCQIVCKPFAHRDLRDLRDLHDLLLAIEDALGPSPAQRSRGEVTDAVEWEDAPVEGGAHARSVTGGGRA